MVKRWKDFTPRQRAGVLTLASVQLSMAVAAWADLATRPPERVRGPKPLWAAVIAVNWVGPIAYFLKGRRS